MALFEGYTKFYREDFMNLINLKLWQRGSLFFLFLVVSVGTWAGVNLRNGNFYISYTDIVIPGEGEKLKITRTYNSKSTRAGWFGFGWGSLYETRLEVGADGSVTVHEHGGGAQTRFSPKKAIDSNSAAQKIVAAMKKAGREIPRNFAKKLAKNQELRHSYARQFNVSASLSEGTELYASTRGFQKLRVTKKGFERVYSDGKTETFDKQGRLTKMRDKNGQGVDLTYKGKNLASIKDSSAKQLLFSWHSTGRVKCIWSATSKKSKACYKYSGEDLIESKDIVGNIYRYSYDGSHNMTSITYPDKSMMKISYASGNQFVKEVVEKDGSKRSYKYESNPKRPKLHYWTLVTNHLNGGKKVTNRYEYDQKVRKDGSQYTHRTVISVNGVTTETTYSESCNLPEKIKKGKNVTTFKYNSKCFLERKVSSRGENVELKYHKKFNKITKIADKRKKTWSEFKYNKKGNLSSAKNSLGQQVALVYGSDGRVTRMIDMGKSKGGRNLAKAKKKGKVSMDFTYNSLGKPVKIKMSGVGTVTLVYDRFGKIKDIKNSKGSKAVLQKVTATFQSLLAIVKPAGVSLGV